MFPARFELATFRVLGGRDNHYTTENTLYDKVRARGIIGILSLGRTRKLMPPLWHKGEGGWWMELLPGVLICCSFLNYFTFIGKPLIFLTR